MPNFTADEQALINAQKLPDEDKPLYYSRTTQSEQVISDSFESFLILQRSSQKQVSMDWIDRALDIEVDNEDRDVLLGAYLDNLVEDAEARVTELDEKLQNFDDFMSSLFAGESETGGPSRFSDIAELNLFVQSLQRPLSKLTTQQEQAFHDQTMAAILKQRHEGEITDEDTRTELDSWNAVLSAYEGQSG